MLSLVKGWHSALRGNALPLAADGRRALVAIYLRQAGINLLAVSIALSLCVALLWGRVPLALLALWALPFGLLVAINLWHYRQVLRRPMPLRAVDRTLATATVRAGIVGLLWGATCLYLPYLDAERRITITLVSVGLSVAATATLSATPKAARAYIGGTILPYAIFHLYQGALPSLVIAVMALLLLLALLLATQLNHRSLISALRARRSAERANAELQTAQRHWQELSETAEAFALYDEHGRLLLWNDAYLRLLDLPAGIVRLGASWSEIVARSGMSMLPETEVLEHDGADPTSEPRIWTVRHRWYRSSIRRLPNRHIAASHVDITELKAHEARLIALQDELRAARDAAEAASDAKSRFLANMSHELRTPLNAVIGFSDLVVQDHARKRVDPERHLSYAQTILDSGHHLLAIVEDMLDLARVEAGQIRLVESDADLVELARQAVRITLGRRSDISIRLIEEFTEPAPRARLDARLTRQALINLLGNAIKFSKPDGRVWLRVTGGDDGSAVLEVRDEGIGIPTHMLDEVLRPFGQVETSEARRFGGVGLGLPLAKQFIELQGGRIELASEEGKGTTVRLVVPADRMLPTARSFAAE